MRHKLNTSLLSRSLAFLQDCLNSLLDLSARFGPALWDEQHHHSHTNYRAEQQPDHYHDKKIWPRSNCEILKPGWIDVAGFGGSCVLVGVVILLLWTLVNLGR